MKDINVQYSVFKSVFGKAPAYYQEKYDGTYNLYAVSEDLFITCFLVEASDITDFNNNYKSSSTPVSTEDEARLSGVLKNNLMLVTPRSALGTIGQSPSKGLGGFVPDPINNPYQPKADEIVGLYVDVEGSLVTRGQSFTDEGSFRDDFIGTALVSNITGTVTMMNGSDIVTGVGTIFTQELNRDNYIKLSIDGYENWASVVRVPTDTTLQIDGPYTGSSGSGTVNKTRWIEVPIGPVPGSTSITNSIISLSSGTDGYSGVYIWRDGDYPPLLGTFTFSISQMVNGQTAFIGFRDDILNPKMYCDVMFPGTDASVVTFRSAWNNDEQSSIIDLPSGLLTTSELRYKIDVSIDYCALIVNGVLVAKHENHVPDPYATLNLCAGIYNEGATTNTTMSVDTVLFSNQDQVQVASTFVAPLNMITKEDQHTLIGVLNTTSTTSNQVIVSYTVPDGKVFYIIGYRIENEGSLTGSILKIGRNDISSEVSSPGVVGGNLFRVFTLNANSSTGEIDFGSNPRKLGVGGDVIKVTVSPSGILSNNWHVALDFVLR